jgi:hypothetical protein
MSTGPYRGTEPRRRPTTYATALAARARPIRTISVGRSIWFDPRAAVREAVRGNAAWFVILIAWAVGIVEGLSSAIIGAKPNGGGTTIFKIVLALYMGPVLSFAIFFLYGRLQAMIGNALGGCADASDARVALACGSIPELLWLPIAAVWLLHGAMSGFQGGFWASPAIAWVSLGLYACLWLWGVLLRIVALAEVHRFGKGRAFATIALAWVAWIVLFVGLVLGGAALLKAA